VSSPAPELPAPAAAASIGITDSSRKKLGLNLVLRALARDGGVTCVAFEDPGYGSAQEDETVRAALAVGIRVSYVPPSPLASAVADEKEMSDRGSCTLDQLALATLLTTGRYDRHLRRMRTVYAARRTALTNAFARHTPRVQLTGLAAGFQAVAPLPPGAEETAVIAAARDRRVGLHGIGGYRGNPDTAAPPALVMGFGNVRERAIEPAIAAVADLLS
jgi:GntR family transcriptional regulator/MocR family aminotransferase